MKKAILLFTLLLGMATPAVFAQRQGMLTINTRFTGIIDGYDLNTKTVIYMDGNLVGETTEQLQSEPNSCSVNLRRGKHTFRIVNMARCNGKWEEHTYKNNYSIDALYETKIKLKKRMTINLLFDISKEKTFATLK
jgi:hypothetical protein